MSNQTEITTAYSVSVRDNDELEGALLLPVATAVGDGSDGGGGCASTNVLPQSSFEYETAIAAEQQRQHQQQIQQVQIDVEDEEEEQIAYNIPNTNSHSAAITDDSRSKVQKAQNFGLVASEEEQEAIRRANMKIFPLGYHTDAAVRQANQIAKQRDCSGLQVTDAMQQQQHELLAMSTSTSSTEKDEKNEKKKNKKGGYNVGGGYEVNEYQLGNDYEVKEYKTSEYKSVYD